MLPRWLVGLCQRANVRPPQHDAALALHFTALAHPSPLNAAPPHPTPPTGADLDVAMEMAKGHMDGDLSWVIFDILANRNEWCVLHRAAPRCACHAWTRGRVLRAALHFVASHARAGWGWRGCTRAWV